MIPLWKIKREIKRAFSSNYREQIFSEIGKTDSKILAQLTNKYDGGRCFVIGNGPSLTVADLELIKGEVSFASNKIFLIYDETDWRPNFYSVEDRLVFEQCLDEIKELQGSQKLFPVQMFHNREPLSNVVRFPILPPNNWDTPLEDPNFPSFSPSFETGIAWGSTIVYTQIQMAIAMGFKEVCVLGLDHSYTLGRTVEGEQGVMVHDGEQNHFHPKYRKPGEKWHSPNLHVLDVSYAKAQAETQALDVQIINCSRKTALNTFRRESLESVLARGPKGARMP